MTTLSNESGIGNSLIFNTKTSPFSQFVNKNLFASVEVKRDNNSKAKRKEKNWNIHKQNKIDIINQIEKEKSNSSKILFPKANTKEKFEIVNDYINTSNENLAETNRKSYSKRTNRQLFKNRVVTK